ncbi:Iron-containing redox enzyme [Streptomyces sp. 2231.1]|uniref:iron-containing redox enzyme family protein n=1 Tax=Streptomyces sp. 2231.1 TaxID=1855347 RepID=UPI000898CE4E|nr:iron-containing redox enzyme family protein [Streptomyces sp. 2231.1]SEE65642.1 Iron-containing redox enzyme [Streptomyces sp. 2231.1]
MRGAYALRTKIELVLPGLQATAHRLFRSPHLVALYPEYLCALHAIIRSTVPLMELALERSLRLADDDPVARGVATYLRRHIREEQGHDEWVREDLAAIGFDPDEPLRRLPSPAVATLVGAQYYWIKHYHPACLLGHIAVVEGYPPPRQLSDDLAARTGYPRAGFRTLERHAVLDTRHRDELMETLDGLPLSPDLHKALGVSALHTVDGATQVIEEVLASESLPAPLASPTRQTQEVHHGATKS